MIPETVVVIPTYNENENIASLVRGLRSLGIPGLEIVVVDDQSPDGTGETVQALSKEDPGVRLLPRTPPAGRGLAGREGFIEALRLGAKRIIEMDGDFSHDPAHVPKLLEAIENADLAIGSRAVEGGSDTDRPWWRRFLTRGANAFARTMLGLSIRDANSGFRAYRREALEAIDPASLKSKGPSIVHEVLFRASRKGLRGIEVPIRFVDRKKGRSKLGLPKLMVGYFWIIGLRLFGSFR